MFCKNCGKELQENSKFCPGCGEKVGDGDSACQQPVGAAGKKKKEKIREFFDKLGVLVLLITVYPIGMYFLWKNKTFDRAFKKIESVCCLVVWLVIIFSVRNYYGVPDIINNHGIAASKDTVAEEEKIEVTKYSWIEDNVWFSTENTGYKIQNNSDSTMDVTLKIKCYDENGGYLDTRKETIYALAAQEKYFIVGKFEDKIKRVECEYGYRKSRHKSLSPNDVIVSGYDKGLKFIIRAKNNSSIETSECQSAVIFYDSNKEILYAEKINIHNGSIPPGEIVTEEIDEPMKYDSYEIFANAY